MTDDPGPAVEFKVEGPPKDTKKLRIVAAVVILLVSLSYFFIGYDRSRTSEAGLQSWYQGKRAGLSTDVDRYRIGLPFLCHFLEVHTPLEMRQSLPLIDAGSYGLGLVALYLMLVDSTTFRRADRNRRSITLALFLAALQFPILWISPWGRPETLPTMFYLAATVLLIAYRRIPFALVLLLIACLSLWQSLLRTDAVVTVGVACLLAAVLNLSLPRPRKFIAIFGCACVLIGGGMQLYLNRLFPPPLLQHRPSEQFQLWANLNPINNPFHLPEVATALLPFLFSAVVWWRYRTPLDGVDKLAVLVALIYLPLYLLFGLVIEVRLYVPYMYILTPLIAKLWMSFLSEDSTTNVRRLSAST